MSTNLIGYLGPNSYPAIVSSIFNKLNESTADTISGNEILKSCIQKLNESITPILDLKEFTTNAEQVAPNDAKLATIIEFARNEVKNGDLNFMINLAKEEHYQGMSRTGLPSPQATLRSIESEFNEPASIIEQGIKKGIFDSLESNLYMELKSIISDDKSKNPVVQPNQRTDISNSLNESYSQFGNIVTYSPVGIKVEDVANNRTLLLTESDVLSFDKATESFFSLNESEINGLNIPLTHKSLMGAISTLGYNPETQVFSLNESWDFNLMIAKNGTVSINNTPIEKTEVVGLLMESIAVYESDAALHGKNFEKAKFTKDADNFIMLMENHDRLLNFDKLRTIRNLNDGKYVVVDRNENKIPVIITSTTGAKLFESYGELVNEASVLLNESIYSLFTNHLQAEHKFIQLRESQIVSLLEGQKELNTLLSDVRNLIPIAEEGSPAMEKLNEQQATLSAGLDKNLENLNFLKNKANLYYNPIFESKKAFKIGDEVTTGTGINGKIIKMSGDDVFVMVDYENGKIDKYEREFDIDQLQHLQD